MDQWPNLLFKKWNNDLVMTCVTYFQIKNLFPSKCDSPVSDHLEFIKGEAPWDMHIEVCTVRMLVENIG